MGEVGVVKISKKDTSILQVSLTQFLSFAIFLKLLIVYKLFHLIE